MAEAAKAKNQSEVLFEKYLKNHDIKEWDYEPEVAGKSHQLDYRLIHKGTPHFFDVKEFREEDREKGLEQGEGSAFDPYSPIRKKIHGVREQFSEYKEFPCSLVLCNIDAALVFLDDWTIVMGAMLGDLGLRFSVDTSIGAAVGDFTSAFSSRGKMVDYKHLKPQNTTINALIALVHLPLGTRLLASEFKRAEAESKKKMTWEEFLHFAETLKTKGLDAAETRLRVVVYENPYARIPLSRQLFTGPYDERFDPMVTTSSGFLRGKRFKHSRRRKPISQLEKASSPRKRRGGRTRGGWRTLNLSRAWCMRHARWSFCGATSSLRYTDGIVRNPQRRVRSRISRNKDERQQTN